MKVFCDNYYSILEKRMIVPVLEFQFFSGSIAKTAII